MNWECFEPYKQKGGLFTFVVLMVWLNVEVTNIILIWERRQ